MVVRCGLNRLNQFAAFLMKHFRNAREDAKLLSIMRTFDDILYSGMALPIDDEQWALKNGLKLRVSRALISKSKIVLNLLS